jgi:cell division protein FtsA
MSIIVGIDIGTTKICTVVARVEADGQLRILGVGIEPSAGIRKGTVIDVGAASNAVGLSIEKAERVAGREITSAWVSLAGSHVSSMNSQGVASVHHQVIDQDDIARAMDAAAAVAIPHNREVIHVIQRGFTVDGQDGIRMPIGMHGYRMEVEAHIITASGTTVDNLRLVVGNSDVEVASFVLNPLASGEVVLTETERDMGVIVCDIGGGTTDMALYIEGDVWHTMVLAVGGNHITSDIAHGLRLPFSKAEEVKINHGHALTAAINPAETFPVRAFGEDQPVDVSRLDLAHIIEARVEEIFSLIMQEIKRSGYDGLLPAGVVLTGGSSQLPGIRRLASEVMGLPVRVARPENLVGMVDQLHSPAYSTSIGLLEWASRMHAVDPSAIAPSYTPSKKRGQNWDRLKDVLKRFFP